MSYEYLFYIALILISTKLLGLLTKKVHMPQVVGALFAGLILGPAVLDILHGTEFINQMAELGVIVLMFTAGLETDIKELKKTGKASFVIALLGVIVPLLGGFILAHIFNEGDPTLPASLTLQNIFIGVILTATSVSITVETLKELGKLSTRAGNAILGAALIDDILGIVALTVITSLAGSGSEVDVMSIVWVLAKIVAFFLCAGLVGFLFYKGFSMWTKKADKDLRRFVIVAFAFCLLMAFTAEHFFGVADITGSFIAGLIISNTQRTKYIASRFDTMSYMLLSPIFFASIGIKVELTNMTGKIVLFSVILLIVAIITKIVGCGIGAKMCGFSNKESLQIGTGMVSRGEVALIVASKGAAVGLMGGNLFGPIAIMVVITTIITPILLKVVFRSKEGNAYEGLMESSLVENYSETSILDSAEQHLLDWDKQMRK